MLLLCALGGSAQIITTVAGNGGTVLGDVGPAVNASLEGPYGVAFDSHGNMYVTDGYNNRIRKINTSGIITTVAGTGVQGYNGDSIPATTAQIYRPVGITLDASDNIYFCDGYNNRVRKIDVAGIITTVAGNGDITYNGDNIPATAAAISNPHCVALGHDGSLYITDCSNHRVRKVNTSGIITTIAGTGVSGYSGDNAPATDAMINFPYGIALDTAENIYFLDSYENVLRRIDGSGTIITVVGNGTTTPLGDNGPATAGSLNGPGGISIGLDNTIYITDAHHERIRQVKEGVITTIVGTGTLGFSGDNGPATAAQIGLPGGIYVDKNTGDVFFTDFANDRVRRIGWPLGVAEQTKSPILLNIYPNPTNGVFTCDITGQPDETFNISITDIAGRVVKTVELRSGLPTQVERVLPGLYIVSAVGRISSCSAMVLVR